jgi:DNA (cytosine-5)-methyltransferase 1
MTMIPVVDIFAGPGGLGEGFSACLDAQGAPRFKLAISIEKDRQAHATLRLRAFRRAFAGSLPREYEDFISGRLTWPQLSERFPTQATHAESEAVCMELGPASVEDVRARIRNALGRPTGWVLIGGPPCQAYSLAGRSRNKGIADYRPELDHRQTLYVEYLQILADHAPPVFVMENVKGLLSAQLESQRLFSRIVEDLSNPARALSRENRTSPGSQPRYTVQAIAAPSSGSDADPSDFVVRAELFGIPQRRHRVILIGVRDDVRRSVEPLRPIGKLETVADALRGLPKVRSGLSKEADSDDVWLAHLRSLTRARWLKSVDKAVRREIESAIDGATRPAAGRGGDYLEFRGRTAFNHATRSHIRSDLERYLFASAFASATGVSPVLGDFPSDLLPQHDNVSRALGSGLFSDRFRVQVAGRPSTTITSHISKDGHYYIHYDASQCRSLTVREAARLQTFPDDYFFCGPRTSQYHQVGNAVPPALAQQIAHSVAKLLTP